MWGIRKKRNSWKHHLLEVFLILSGVLLFCEYLVYYVVIYQCEWPNLDPEKIDVKIAPQKLEERPLKAMFLTDTHLLGNRKGHWFDKLRREWQMHRAFQSAVTIHKPEVIFILGDIFDEGLWGNSAEFKSYIKRFQSLFPVPQNSYLYVVAGNHDMGFHYAITPYLNDRFINAMKAPNVRRITFRGNHFVLINSMAMEGDNCFLCKATENSINKISKQLKCAEGIGDDCTDNTIKRYSRPILLQHYPMYRDSDKYCNESDEAPPEIKEEKNRERWECLSKEASEQLLDILNPRLILDGHTHHGCRKLHRNNILEMTISSFSWRNKNNPSFLLGIFTPDNYSISKCHMPMESTVMTVYACAVIIYIIYKALTNRILFHHLFHVKYFG